MSINAFYSGNTINYTMTFTKTDLSPINVAGWLIILTFKHAIEDADSAAVIQKFYTLPDNVDTQAGVATITLESTDTDNFVETKNYFYGFKRVIAGSPPDVVTLENGKVKVTIGTSSVVVEHAFVPNVYNVVSATAQTTLINAGFTIGNITNEVSVAVPPIVSGNVISTTPAAGSYQPLGTVIDIVVAT